MNCRIATALLCVGCLMGTAELSADSNDLAGQIQVLTGVEPGAESHAAAKAAVKQIEQAGPQALVPLAKAIGQGNALADNWLRGTFESIAADGIDDVQSDLVAFFHDRSNAPRARRLVYETLVDATPEMKEQLLSSAIDDPSEEMRADAVNVLVDSVENESDEEVKRKVLERALANATVKSQVDAISKQVESLGGDFDPMSHYGFLKEWNVVGPFDNKDEKGFDVPYGPEKDDLSAPDLSVTFEGTEGESTWTALNADDKTGVIDLAEQIAPHKGALVYATTTFESDRERPVEIRLSTANAWKMWLNGQPMFEREEYHRGMQWDQYRVPATLAKGPNVIVLKVLQNEQDQSWAQRWSYSVRITDPTGRGVGKVAKR